MIPIVLHHGLFGFGNFEIGSLRLSYFSGIDRAISERGNPLIVSRVHPTGSIATRARQLKETILRQLDILGRPRERVFIIGHSMGGLDARYMISQLGMDDRVVGLLTVTTPHRGSAFADYCVQHLGRLGAFRLFNMIGLDVQAASDLTTTACARFNETVPDSPQVRYFSVSAARPWNRIPPFALPSHRVIQQAEGDNDCLVSVRSAQWGEHLGTWPADHFHTINRRLVLELRNATGSIVPYYLRALDEITRRGVDLGAARRQVERCPHGV